MTQTLLQHKWGQMVPVAKRNSDIKRDTRSKNWIELAGRHQTWEWECACVNVSVWVLCAFECACACVCEREKVKHPFDIWCLIFGRLDSEYDQPHFCEWHGRDLMPFDSTIKLLPMSFTIKTSSLQFKPSSSYKTTVRPHKCGWSHRPQFYEKNTRACVHDTYIHKSGVIPWNSFLLRTHVVRIKFAEK